MDKERVNKARTKITEEALKANNIFATFIEEYLNSICKNDVVASKLMAEDKSLEAFCKKCRDEAKKKAREQGSGVQIWGLPDAEYQKMAEEYYGITEADKGTAATIIDIMDFI